MAVFSSFSGSDSSSFGSEILRDAEIGVQHFENYAVVVYCEDVGTRHRHVVDEIEVDPKRYRCKHYQYRHSWIILLLLLYAQHRTDSKQRLHVVPKINVYQRENRPNDYRPDLKQLINALLNLIICHIKSDGNHHYEDEELSCDREALESDEKLALGLVAVSESGRIEVFGRFEEIGEDFLEDPEVKEKNETTAEGEERQENFIEEVEVAHFFFIIIKFKLNFNENIEIIF